jgi:amino acid transporter
MSRGRLRRELGAVETVAVSIGVMAPTLAMSITGVDAARVLGRAASLAFVLAAVGLAFVVYGFARLTSHISNAGSVYALTGATLGPRAGFVAGWAMLGTYLVFNPVSLAGIAIFGQAFLRETGIAPHAPWLPIALVGWAAVAIMASQDIRLATRSLLLVEGVSALLILILVGVIFGKLGLGGAPHGLGFSATAFELPNGIALSTVALAGTVGFLSFAGFESSASLGEEATAPTRMIPRSLVIAVLVGGAFYIVCMTAQSLGFGTDAAGVRAFTQSGAPLGGLAHTYLGTGMAAALDLGAVLSAFGAAVGGAAVGSRLLFALGRDGAAPGGLASVSARTGAPALAVAVVMTLSAVGLIVYAARGTPPIHVFFYFGTMGILSLLVVYLFTTVGAIRFLFGAERRAPRRELVLPLGGLLIVGYTLYRNLHPAPPSPFNVFPYVVAAWLIVGIALALARRRRPGLG